MLVLLVDGAQGQTSPAVEPPLTTLHMYANLAQLPVLVLDDDYRPSAPIAFDLFRVSVDSGKPFVPVKVRREGDEPINLSVLLDVSGSQGGMMKELPKVIERWAQGSLLAHDRVSVYAVDCAVVRTGEKLPGSEPGMIRTAVDLALDSKAVHGTKEKPACWGSKRLWDAVNLLTAQLAGADGRRVVLAITDGHDGGSRAKWTDVRMRAATNAVAIFGMSELQFVQNPLLASGPRAEDAFNALCQLSGGIILPGQSAFAQSELRDFVKMVRDRYLLEFPRPRGLDLKQHTIEVTIRKHGGIIRPASLSMTVETDEEKAAENQPTEPVPTPELGTRRVLAPQ